MLYSEIDQFRIELGVSPRNRKQRKCLRCGRAFLSDSPENRRCKECKEDVKKWLGRGMLDAYSYPEV